MIAASAALGTSYAFKLGAAFGPFVAVAFAAMALGGELVKPVAVERAFAAGWRRPLQALACLAVAMTAIAYSLAAELAFSAGARGDAAAGRQAAITAAGDARAAAKRAADELAALKPARPVAELEAVIAGAKTTCRPTVSLRGQSDVCSKPPALLAELARAKRRAELEAKIAAAQIVASDNKIGVADPQAAAVVSYLAAVGVTADPEAVAVYLHLLPVMLLEIGSALGLLVASGMDRQASARFPATDTPAGEGGTPARVPANVVTLPVGGRKAPARLPAPSTHPVLEALQRAGKPLSVTELAQAMQVSAGEASKRWQEVAPQLVVGWAGRHRSIGLRAS